MENKKEIENSISHEKIISYKKVRAKKIIAILLIVIAVVNLTLLALGKLKPGIFIIVLTFVALISFSYFKNENNNLEDKK